MKNNSSEKNDIQQLKNKIADLEKDNTRLKRSEKVLKQSEERFRKMSESAFEGIGIHDKGRIIDANKQLAKMLKIKLDELIGRNVSDFIAPESREIVEQHIKLGTEEPYEHFVKRIDGSIFPVEVQAKSLSFEGKTLRVTAIRDITERKQAEEAIKNSEERLKIIFESAPDAIYLTDLKGTFIDGNKTAENILGYKKEELIGKSFLKLKLLSAGDLLKASKLLIKNAQGDGTGPDEFLLIRKDGNQIPVEISTYPVKIKNNIVVLGIARDITERKQAEEKLISRNKELETWSEVAIGRELFMLNLKKEINELLEKSGKKPKYKIPI